MSEWISLITIGTFANWKMVSDRTFSIQSTGSITGVDTLLFRACKLSAAFIIDNTLRSAAWRRTSVARLTGTHGFVCQGFTSGVWSAWRRLARVSGYWGRRGSYWYSSALSKWVSFMRRWTGADWNMSDDLAQCTHSTSAHTGVLTFVDNTSKVRGTVRAEHTLWSAVRRSSKVARRATADTSVTYHTLAGVGTTEIVTTGISGL